MSNIYLIGMMGSGKSVTGKQLAAMLHCHFLDLDDCIQEKTRRTIVDLFEKEGEESFREKESEVLREISGISPRVIATGGGSILRPANVERMKATGRLVFLEASLPVLWERVKHKKDRPLLKGPDPHASLERILEERRPRYEQVCDFKVDTDGQTAGEVAQKIFDLLDSAPKTGAPLEE